MKLTFREFKARACYYVKEMKVGKVFEIGGAKIGLVDNDYTEMSVEDNVEEIKEAHIRKKEMVNDGLVCKCKHAAQYDDGKRLWCDECLLSEVGGDWKKFTGTRRLMKSLI